MTFFNPRLPSEEKKQGKKLPKIPGHVWIMTSGSTGAQKWVLLSYNAILESARAVNEHLLSNKNDLWLHALPDFHVGGIGIWARAHLSSAGVVKIKQKWDPHSFAAAAKESGATLTSLVPAQLHDLASQSLQAPKTLRASVIGGGGLAEELYFKARALGWKPLPSYGLTEAASQVATAALSSLEAPAFPLLSILPHLHVEEHEFGMRIKGSSLLTAYGWIKPFSVEIEDPKKEGFFQTTDMGRVENGTLTVLGRRDQKIKVGGELVDIERLNTLAKAELPLHGDAAFAALPDERLGHIVIVATAHLDKEESKKFIKQVNERLLPFERPKKHYRLDNIPRSPLGKIQMGILTKRIIEIGCI